MDAYFSASNICVCRTNRMGNNTFSTEMKYIAIFSHYRRSWINQTAIILSYLPWGRFIILRLQQNCHHFVDDVYKRFSWKKSSEIWIKITGTSVEEFHCQTINIGWGYYGLAPRGSKPYSEPCRARLLYRTTNHFDFGWWLRWQWYTTSQHMKMDVGDTKYTVIKFTSRFFNCFFLHVCHSFGGCSEFTRPVSSLTGQL